MRLPKVFRPISRLVAALQGLKAQIRQLTEALADLRATQQAQGPAAERLEALELSRLKFEAVCEGLLQKAEGKLAAARNAEARERANKRSYEHLLDPFPEDGVEPAPTRGTAIENDAAPSEEDRMLGVRMAVASTNPKTLAQRAKFGVK